MKLKNTFQRLLLTASMFIAPALLLLGIWLLTSRARNDWASFTALCARSWDTLVGFVSQNGTLWIAVAAAVFSVGLLRGLVFLVKQIRNVRRLRREFRSKLILNDSNEKLVMVNDRRLYAVTIGFIKPVTYLSKGLLNRLTQAELRAVLAHEQYHVQQHHPLTLLLVNTFRVSLFFLPALKNIVSYITLRSEFLADQAAIMVTSRKVLASALLKTLKIASESSFPVSAAAFAQGANRVAAIINSNAKPVLRLSKWLTVISLIIVAGIGFLFFMPRPSQAHHLANNQVASNDFSGSTAYCHGQSQTIFSFVGLNRTELNPAPEQSTVQDFATLRMTQNQE